MTRRKIIFDTLSEQYPEIDRGVLDTLAEEIDTHWHILKRDSLDGLNGEWTLSGHLQAHILTRLYNASKASAAAHRILRKLAEEKSRP
jgi:hypothetical protein